jgi:hypothetical protein
MLKSRSELASIWPPASDVTREADHRPQSPLNEEGVLRLMRLPTLEEAAEIRRAAGIRQSRPSLSAGRRFIPAKAGDTATSVRFDEQSVPDLESDARPIHDADGGAT